MNETFAREVLHPKSHLLGELQKLFRHLKGGHFLVRINKTFVTVFGHEAEQDNLVDQWFCIRR